MHLLWPLAIALSLSISGCGDDPPPAPVDEPSAGPSVADLLATTSEPSSANTEAAAPAETAPAGEANAPDVASTPEAPPPSAGECEAARAKLKAAQEKIDKQRERALLPLQETASKAQVNFESCMIAGKTCTDNASKFKRLLEQRDATAKKVSAVLDKIGAQEAGLFPLSQAVDRSCQ